MAEDAWFEPKRYGYGAGLPVAWQGWALIAGYLAVLGLCSLLIEWNRGIGGVAAFALAVPATFALIVVCARKTRGGWRWRWGDHD